MRLESVDYGFDDERQIRELLAGRPLELRAVLRANARQPRKVDLEERADVRRGVARRDHMLADERAHLGHRFDDVARPWLRHWEVWDGGSDSATRRRRGGGVSAGSQEIDEIAFRDAARDAGSLKTTQLDSVLGGHAPNERRGFRPDALLERLTAVSV